MTTRKQIEANRQNAKKSTGPKTVEGKNRSSKNAVVHGLLSRDLVIYGEDHSDYEAFRQDLMNTFYPKGPIELLLVEKIASYVWRQRRAILAESALFHNGLSNEQEPRTYEGFFVGSDGNCLQNLTRYESMLEKNFYRALLQLQMLQKAREESSWDLL